MLFCSAHLIVVVVFFYVCHNLRVKILCGHCPWNNLYFSPAGTADPVVAYTFGQMTNEVLHKLCSKHEFKSYSGLPHSSSPQVRKNE